MTTRVQPVAAILSEDIRHEEGNTFSIMGVCTPVLQCREFPAAKRIAVSLVISGNSVGDAELEISLLWKDEVKWAVEMEIEIDAVGTGSVVPVGETYAYFDEPGSLKLQVQTEGSTYDVQVWDVQEFPS